MLRRRSRSCLGAGVSALAVLETVVFFWPLGSRKAKLSLLLDVWVPPMGRVHQMQNRCGCWTSVPTKCITIVAGERLCFPNAKPSSLLDFWIAWRALGILCTCPLVDWCPLSCPQWFVTVWGLCWHNFLAGLKRILFRIGFCRGVLGSLLNHKKPPCRAKLQP